MTYCSGIFNKIDENNTKTLLELLNEMNDEGYPEEALFLMFEMRKAIHNKDFGLASEYNKKIQTLKPKVFEFDPDWDATNIRPESDDLEEWKSHVTDLERIIKLYQKGVEKNNHENEKVFVGDSDHEK